MLGAFPNIHYRPEDGHTIGSPQNTHSSCWGVPQHSLQTWGWSYDRISTEHSQFVLGAFPNIHYRPEDGHTMGSLQNTHSSCWGPSPTFTTDLRMVIRWDLYRTLTVRAGGLPQHSLQTWGWSYDGISTEHSQFVLGCSPTFTTDLRMIIQRDLYRTLTVHAGGLPQHSLQTWGWSYDTICDLHRTFWWICEYVWLPQGSGLLMLFTSCIFSFPACACQQTGHLIITPGMCIYEILRLGTFRCRGTLGWGHLGVGTPWGGGTLGWGHLGVGTPWGGDTLGWGHLGVGPPWSWGTFV